MENVLKHLNMEYLCNACKGYHGGGTAVSQLTNEEM